MPLLRVYLTSPIASCVCSLIDNSREPIRNEYSHFLLQKVCFLRREYADARVTAEVIRTVVTNNRTIPWCNLFINSLFTRCRSSVWYRPRTFFPIETTVKTTLTQQGEHQVQTCTEQECNVQGKKKKLRCASESSVFLVQLLTLLVLWASWKELQEQVCFMACPERCAKELCPKWREVYMIKIIWLTCG